MFKKIRKIYRLTNEAGIKEVRRIKADRYSFPCLTCHLRAETTNAPTAFWRSLRAYVKRKCYNAGFLLPVKEAKAAAQWARLTGEYKFAVDLQSKMADAGRAARMAEKAEIAKNIEGAGV